MTMTNNLQVLYLKEENFIPSSLLSESGDDSSCSNLSLASTFSTVENRDEITNNNAGFNIT